MKTNFKNNDIVKVLTGKNRGKTGKVIQVLPQEHMVVIDGINKMYKYVRAQRKGEKGQRIEFFGPLAIGKVMLVCPKCNKSTRISIKHEGGKRVRVCKKCQMTIE